MNINTIIADKNPYIKSNLCVFLTINNPVIKTIGVIQSVATHQLADSPKNKLVNTTEIATGLKMCFCLTVHMYLVAIASMGANTASAKNSAVLSVLIGEMISAKISPVIYADSEFVGTLYTCANTLFMTKEIVTMHKVEKTIA
jgi:hypothetical protein